jgi:hypothetical protein
VRRRSALALVGLGAVAGVVVRRRFLGRGGERVDLYFDDGAMISLDDDAPAAGALLPIARELLGAVAS